MARPLRDDPIVRQLVDQARRTQLTRRTLLSGLGVGGVSLALAACATESSLSPATDHSSTDKTLTWANWPAYLDQAADGSYPSLAAFSAKSGITIDYKTSISDNNTFYNFIKDPLGLGQYPGADTFCLNDWLVARLIRFGYVQDLDASRIPNKKNLTPTLSNPDFDPGRQKSLPWQSGLTGMIWDAKAVPAGLRQVQDLWEPALKGRVTVLSEMRDTMGLILLSHNVVTSSDNWGTAEFTAAIAELQAQVASGQLLAIRGSEYVQDLSSGAAVAAIGWSGDVIALNAAAGYEKFKFTLPESGGMLWSDTFVVPLGSPRRQNVETLLDYYYEPEVAAEVVASVHSITPVDGAKEVAAAKYPDVAANPLIFPDDSTLARSRTFRTLSSADDQIFNGAFQQLVQGA